MNSKCEKCGDDHDGTFGSGRFCSIECASSRTQTKEINEKRSKAMMGKPGKNNWTPESLDQFRNRKKETALRKLWEADFNTLSWELRRKRVILEQDGKCLHCGIDEWMNEPIVLQVDHIDGNNKDHVRKNLRGLCPNCHSQTPTWCGRNKVYEHFK